MKQDKSVSTESIDDTNSKQEQLINKISDMINKYQDSDNQPTATIFVRGVKDSDYKSYYKVLDKQDVKGIMLLTLEDFPGKDDCITLEQFSSLVESGWRYAYYYDESGDLDSYLEGMEQNFADIGYKVPKALFSMAEDFGNENLQIATVYDIDTIIQYRSNALNVVNLRAKSNDIWYLGAVNWDQDSLEQCMDYVKRVNGSFGVIITTANAKATKSKIKKLLKDLSSNGIDVKALAEAREFRQSMYQKIVKNIQDEDTVDELNQMIQEASDNVLDTDNDW